MEDNFSMDLGGGNSFGMIQTHYTVVHFISNLMLIHRGIEPAQRLDLCDGKHPTDLPSGVWGSTTHC